MNAENQIASSVSERTVPYELPEGKASVVRCHRHLVTERDIRHFRQAIGESDPAGHGQCDPATAPLLFCQMFAYEDVSPEALLPDGSPRELRVPVPAERTMGGNSDFEFFSSVRAGDEITVTTMLKQIYQREGRSGTLFFVEVQTDFVNQESVLVARETATYVKR